MPDVIYLGPKNNPLAQVGPALEGVAQIVQGIQEGQYQKKKAAALAQASKITDPQQLEQFLSSPQAGLRPQDAQDLTKTLVENRVRNLSIQKTKQDIADGNIEMQMHKFEQEHQPIAFQSQMKANAAEIKLKNAQATEAAARAAGIPSEIAETKARTRLLDAQTRQAQDELKMQHDWMNAYALPDAPKVEPPKPGQPPTPLQKAAATPSTVTPQAKTSASQFFSGRVSFDDYVKNLPTPKADPPTTRFPGVSPQMLNSWQGLPIKEVQKTILEAGKLKKDPKPTMIAPGVAQYFGTYAGDGSRVPMGQPFEQFNKKAAVDENAELGVMMFADLADALETLKKGGKLGDAQKRQITAMERYVTGGKVDLSYLDDNFDATAKFQTLRDHGIVAIGQMLQRKNMLDEKQLNAALPSLGDDDPDFNAKIAGSKNLARTKAYELFNDFTVESKQPSGSFQQFVQQQGLDTTDRQTLVEQALGMDKLPNVGGGEGAAGGGGEGSGAADPSGAGRGLAGAGDGEGAGRGVAPPAATGASGPPSNPSAPGKTIDISGIPVPLTEIMRLAGTTGMSQQQVIEELKKRAQGKTNAP